MTRVYNTCTLENVAVTIPGYEQFRPIGSGGFSTVYEARQPELNRRVAVKVLTLGADQDFDRAAFEGECRAMGTVSEHPNIVTVYESGFSQEGLPYITMELYHETLLDRVKARGHLPLDEVLDVGVLMAGALHRAHQDRLLHRDIKPQNIFFSQYGEPFLGDFGIAALAHEQHAQRSFGLTFHYAAPEVIDGEMPQVESDIYSLGATMYTAIAGHRPFARPGVKESEAVIANRILSEPPPPIVSQPIPDNVERSLLTLLTKHPNDRPRTALEVGKLLRDLQGRLGQPLTPMRVADGDFDSDHTVARRESAASTSQSGVGASGSMDTPADDLDDGLSGSVTVYKEASKDRPTGTVDRSSGPTRPVLAAGIVALVLAVAGIAGFLLLRNDGDGSQSPTNDAQAETAETTTTTELVDNSPPSQVGGIEFVRDGEQLVIARWEPTERAARYRVDFSAGGFAAEATEKTELVIDLSQGDLPVCLAVTAAASNGATARPSEIACFTG